MRCERCSQELQVGDWPFCPHGTSVQTNAFASYFDWGLGRPITGLGDRHRAMRELHLDYRDLISPGENRARRDRAEQQQKDAAQR